MRRILIVVVGVGVAVSLAGCSDSGSTAKAVCDELQAVIDERPDASEGQRRVRAALEDAVGGDDRLLAEAAEEALAAWDEAGRPADLFGVTFRCAQLAS